MPRTTISTITLVDSLIVEALSCYNILINFKDLINQKKKKSK